MCCELLKRQVVLVLLAHPLPFIMLLSFGTPPRCDCQAIKLPHVWSACQLCRQSSWGGTIEHCN